MTAHALSPATAADAAPGEDADIIVNRLPNGLTVLVKPDDRFPLVSLRLYVHAGSTYELPEEAGISHMLEHMVFKGTAKRPRGRVAADVEKTGGYLNAATSFDYTVYLTDMTEEHWKTGLDVLKDMAFHPSLDPAELESEKDVVAAELKRGEDNPGQRLFRLAQEVALKNTPYSDPIIGYENTIRSLTSDAMRAYIERLYQPGAMVLLICGKVNPDEALAEASRLFGDLRNSGPVSPAVPLTAALRPKGFSALVERGPWNKAHIALAMPLPGTGDTRSAQYDVLAQILGGDASSRFHRTYKYEKRLVDSISVANYSFERLGMLFIRATLDADKLAPFWQTFSKDLANLHKSVFSDAEIDRARLNIEDNLFRSKETLAGQTSKLGYFALFGGGSQGEANYLQTVKDTDNRILQGLVREHFRPDAFSLAALLPEGADARPPAPKANRSAEAEEAGKETAADAWSAWFENSLEAVWKAPDDGASEASAAPGKETEVVDLGQGRSVVLIPDATLPYTSVNLIFTGGDALLAEQDQGLAAFTASLLAKGTKKLSATAVDDYLNDRAASFGASSGRQTFSLAMDAPSRFNADMFAFLHDTLVTPAFKDEEAARVRENQIAAIVSKEDQPTGLAFRRMFPFLFSGHPYGYLQLGEKERVAAFRSKDAREFWKRQTLQPWVLAVCGSYDREAVLAAAQKLPVPGKAGIRPDPPVWNADKSLELHLPGRNQAHLFMIFPTSGYGHEDEPALELLQTILAGQSGLLFRDLRDVQGLGYTVTAFPWKTDRAGALIFYIGTEQKKMEQAGEGFRKVIDGLHKTPLPEEELERGKNQIRGDYYRDHQSLASRSGEAAVLGVLQRPLDAARALVDKAEKISADELREIARRYIVPEKAYVVKVLP